MVVPLIPPLPIHPSSCHLSTANVSTCPSDHPFICFKSRQPRALHSMHCSSPNSNTLVPSCMRLPSPATIPSTTLRQAHPRRKRRVSFPSARREETLHHGSTGPICYRGVRFRRGASDVDATDASRWCSCSASATFTCLTAPPGCRRSSWCGAGGPGRTHGRAGRIHELTDRKSNAGNAGSRKDTNGALHGKPLHEIHTAVPS